MSLQSTNIIYVAILKSGCTVKFIRIIHQQNRSMLIHFKFFLHFKMVKVNLVKMYYFFDLLKSLVILSHPVKQKKVCWNSRERNYRTLFLMQRTLFRISANIIWLRNLLNAFRSSSKHSRENNSYFQQFSRNMFACISLVFLYF